MDSEAHILRENTETSGLIRAARAAVGTLAENNIPHHDLWDGLKAEPK